MNLPLLAYDSYAIVPPPMKEHCKSATVLDLQIFQWCRTSFKWGKSAHIMLVVHIDGSTITTHSVILLNLLIPNDPSEPSQHILTYKSQNKAACVAAFSPLPTTTPFESTFRQVGRWLELRNHPRLPTISLVVPSIKVYIQVYPASKASLNNHPFLSLA